MARILNKFALGAVKQKPVTVLMSNWLWYLRGNSNASLSAWSKKGATIVATPSKSVQNVT
jgi:hypothetical protein